MILLAERHHSILIVEHALLLCRIAKKMVATRRASYAEDKYGAALENERQA